jgi:hypothetical protein
MFRICASIRAYRPLIFSRVQMPTVSIRKMAAGQSIAFFVIALVF